MGKLARNHSDKKGEVIQSTKNTSTQIPNSFTPPDYSIYEYTVHKTITRFFFSKLESYYGALAKHLQCGMRYGKKEKKSLFKINWKKKILNVIRDWK